MNDVCRLCTMFSLWELNKMAFHSFNCLWCPLPIFIAWQSRSDYQYRIWQHKYGHWEFKVINYIAQQPSFNHLVNMPISRPHWLPRKTVITLNKPRIWITDHLVSLISSKIAFTNKPYLVSYLGFDFTTIQPQCLGQTIFQCSDIIKIHYTKGRNRN